MTAVWYFCKSPIIFEKTMTTNLKNPKSPTVDTGKPPYPFRTIVSILLLAGNILVAAIYFHVLNP